MNENMTLDQVNQLLDEKKKEFKKVKTRIQRTGIRGYLATPDHHDALHLYNLISDLQVIKNTIISQQSPSFM